MAQISPKPDPKNLANSRLSEDKEALFEDQAPFTDDLPTQLSLNGAEIGTESNDSSPNSSIGGFESWEEPKVMPRKLGGWQKWSLKTKATALALAIGIIPAVSISTVAYFWASKAEEQQALDVKKIQVNSLSRILSNFLSERYGDIKVMAGLSVLTEPQLRETASLQEKQARLNEYIKAYGIYESIVVIDLKGNIIVQAGSMIDPLTS